MRPCEIFDDESAAIVVQHQVDPGGYFFHEEQKICETLGGSQWSLCFIASITAAAGVHRVSGRFFICQQSTGCVRWSA